MHGNTLLASFRSIGLAPKVNKETVLPKLKLSEAILVGNYRHQIKFSELTIDVYRTLQSLEREPLLSHLPLAQLMADETDASLEDAPRKGSNPRKYLLYRPTISQLLLYISTSFKQLGDSSAMLLYLSADGSKCKSKLDNGGVATSLSNTRRTESIDPLISLINTLHASDLVPFTRKPLFLIVDSTYSAAFKVNAYD